MESQMTVESGNGKSRATFGVREWTAFASFAVTVISLLLTGMWVGSTTIGNLRATDAVHSQQIETIAKAVDATRDMESMVIELKTLVGVSRENNRSETAAREELKLDMRGMRSDLRDVRVNLKSVEESVRELERSER